MEKSGHVVTPVCHTSLWWPLKSVNRRTSGLKVLVRESDLHRIRESPCSLEGQGTQSPPGRRKEDLVVKPFGSGSSIPLPGKPHSRRCSDLGQVVWGPWGPRAQQEMSPAFPTASEVPRSAHTRSLSADVWRSAWLCPTAPPPNHVPWPLACPPGRGLPSCRPHRQCRACPSHPVRGKGQRIRWRSDSTHPWGRIYVPTATLTL